MPEDDVRQREAQLSEILGEVVPVSNVQFVLGEDVLPGYVPPPPPPPSYIQSALLVFNVSKFSRTDAEHY
jgi:hypothetical protein